MVVTKVVNRDIGGSGSGSGGGRNSSGGSRSEVGRRRLGEGLPAAGRASTATGAGKLSIERNDRSVIRTASRTVPQTNTDISIIDDSCRFCAR